MEAETAPDFSDLVEGVITTIPLDRLMLSTLNVRQTERAADVDSLAEDIAARGLKQNLVVIPAHFASGEPAPEHLNGEPLASGGRNTYAGRFEVIAGGRRFQAMQRLVEQDRLSATYPVPCMVEFRDAASETSLSENLHRVAMNPADEFEAFRVIVDQARKTGAAEDPIAYCAKRFGVTVKHVNGRLRLAALAPEILDALRANEIGVESAKAYAGVEDHALQLKVFQQQKKSNWQPHGPAQVRGALRDVTLSINDAMVKFVGVDDYVAAGGRVEVEMFMGSEGEQRIADVKLLEKLARDKAEPLVAPLAKKDGYKSGLLASGVCHAARWPKAPASMDRAHDYGQDVSKAKLKRSVGVYAIAQDGIGLTRIGRFRPEENRSEKQIDYNARWAAEERERAILTRAAHIAMPKFAGTIFEGKVFWPAYGRGIEDDPTDEASVLVAVRIRIPRDDVDANRAEAERLIDEEAAAAEAAKVAQSTENGQDPLTEEIESGEEEPA